MSQKELLQTLALFQTKQTELLVSYVQSSLQANSKASVEQVLDGVYKFAHADAINQTLRLKLGGEAIDARDFVRKTSSDVAYDLAKAFAAAGVAGSLVLPDFDCHIGTPLLVVNNMSVEGRGYKGRLIPVGAATAALDLNGAQAARLLNISIEILDDLSTTTGFSAVKLRGQAFRNHFSALRINNAKGIKEGFVGVDLQCTDLAGSLWNEFIDPTVLLMATGWKGDYNGTGSSGGNRIIGGHTSDCRIAMTWGGVTIGKNGSGGTTINSHCIGGQACEKGVVFNEAAFGVTVSGLFIEISGLGANSVIAEFKAGSKQNFFEVMHGSPESLKIVNNSEAGENIIIERGAYTDVNGAGRAGSAYHLPSVMELSKQNPMNFGGFGNLFLVNRSDASALPGGYAGAITGVQRIGTGNADLVQTGSIRFVKTRVNGNPGGGVEITSKGDDGDPEDVRVRVVPDGTHLMDGRLHLHPAAGEPATPAVGFVLFNQGGVLKVKDSAGVVKTVTLA